MKPIKVVPPTSTLNPAATRNTRDASSEWAPLSPFPPLSSSPSLSQRAAYTVADDVKKRLLFYDTSVVTLASLLLSPFPLSTQKEDGVSDNQGKNTSDQKCVQRKVKRPRCSGGDSDEESGDIVASNINTLDARRLASHFAVVAKPSANHLTSVTSALCGPSPALENGSVCGDSESSPISPVVVRKGYRPKIIFVWLMTAGPSSESSDCGADANDGSQVVRAPSPTLITKEVIHAISACVEGRSAAGGCGEQAADVLVAIVDLGGMITYAKVNNLFSSH